MPWLATNECAGFLQQVVPHTLSDCSVDSTINLSALSLIEALIHCGVSVLTVLLLPVLARCYKRTLKASCMYSPPHRFPGAKNSPKSSSQELQRILPAVQRMPSREFSRWFCGFSRVHLRLCVLAMQHTSLCPQTLAPNFNFYSQSG